MKKYTTKHLEGVPPEIILGMEESVRRLRLPKEYFYYSFNTCPAYIAWGIRGCHKVTNGAVCPKYLSYKGDCPCHKFGPVASIAMMENLIRQWKNWADPYHLGNYDCRDLVY